MPETKQIKFEIVGDASQLNRAIEQAVRSVSGLMGQLNKASGGILGGGGGVGPGRVRAGGRRRRGRARAGGGGAGSGAGPDGRREA